MSSIDNNRYDFVDYYYPKPNEKVADWLLTNTYYNDLLAGFEERMKNFPIESVFIKNEIERVDAEIAKSKFDQLNNGFIDFKKGENKNIAEIEFSFFAYKLHFHYDFEHKKIILTNQEGKEISIENIKRAPKGEMLIYLAYYANGYATGKYYYYLQMLLDNPVQQMETTNKKLPRLSNEESKFDLTKYDLVAGFVHPYLPKPMLKGNEYYIYEGRIGNNKFHYYRIPKKSNAGKLCKQFIEKYYLKNEYRYEYYEEGYKLLEACESDAIDKEIGLNAYLKYWNDCLTENDKIDISFHGIQHFEALKEWYNLSLQRHIEKNKSHYLIEDIRNADILKWKRKISESVDNYLRSNEITTVRTYSGITSLHANQLIQFYYWIEEQFSVPKKHTITAPVTALFCNLLNQSLIIAKDENESVQTYCKRVCDKFNLTYNDRIRQNFANKSTVKNTTKVKELILPVINKTISKGIIEYLGNKPPVKPKLYA